MSFIFEDDVIGNVLSLGISNHNNRNFCGLTINKVWILQTFGTDSITKIVLFHLSLQQSSIL